MVKAGKRSPLWRGERIQGSKYLWRVGEGCGWHKGIEKGRKIKRGNKIVCMCVGAGGGGVKLIAEGWGHARVGRGWSTQFCST